MVNRRGFFRQLLGRPEPTSTARTPDSTRKKPKQFGRGKTLPVLRPPGAITEAEFLASCTRCGDCISVCPHDAITLAPLRYREAAGTPMIDPHHSPCLMCEDLPCITACEPKVLREDLPVNMGTAHINAFYCLAG